MSDEIKHRCCEAFAKAILPKSDSEGWLELIAKEEEGIAIGNGLPPIKFCPWCASPIEG